MLLLLVIALLMNSIVGRLICKKRGQGFNGNIMDIGFEFLPNLTEHEWLHDFTLILPIVFVVFKWNNIDQ